MIVFFLRGPKRYYRVRICTKAPFPLETLHVHFDLQALSVSKRKASKTKMNEPCQFEEFKISCLFTSRQGDRLLAYNRNGFEASLLGVLGLIFLGFLYPGPNLS